MDIKYCAFIDVLGYKSIVLDSNRSFAQKANILNSIYSSLATQFLTYVTENNQGKKHSNEEVFMKSFSDCFYLESYSIGNLLKVIKQIFSNTFTFYSGFSEKEEYTPFIRCGIVKDWSIRFNDISSMINGDKNNNLNPIGAGISRAYLTSETTNISGMRIIISDEVISDLKIIKENAGFDYLYDIQLNKELNQEIIFFPISINEKGETINLYELSWVDFQSCTFSEIEQLKSFKANFKGNSIRHWNKTIELFYKALILAKCKNIQPQYNNYCNELKLIIETA
ncbi:MAG: hypothetical protein JXR36_02725 [Bacteroidales bacterium]|nr:hypothetical protein [Bacteroidales bacterium]